MLKVANSNVCLGVQSVEAVNIVTEEKFTLMLEPKLIDEQDQTALEEILKRHVQLDPSSVSIYMQVTESPPSGK